MKICSHVITARGLEFSLNFSKVSFIWFPFQIFNVSAVRDIPYLVTYCFYLSIDEESKTIRDFPFFQKMSTCCASKHSTNKERKNRIEKCFMWISNTWVACAYDGTSFYLKKKVDIIERRFAAYLCPWEFHVKLHKTLTNQIVRMRVFHIHSKYLECNIEGTSRWNRAQSVHSKSALALIPWHSIMKILKRHKQFFCTAFHRNTNDPTVDFQYNELFSSRF